MRLSKRFGTYSNQFCHHVNTTKKFQIDSKTVINGFGSHLKDIIRHVKKTNIDECVSSEQSKSIYMYFTPGNQLL